MSFVYISKYFVFVFYFFGWPSCTACGILVPQPGMQAVPPAVGVWSLNHWTAWVVQYFVFLISKLFFFSHLKFTDGAFRKEFLWQSLSDLFDNGLGPHGLPW